MGRHHSTHAPETRRPNGSFLPEPPAEELPPLSLDEIGRRVRSAADAVTEELQIIESKHDYLANRLLKLLFQDNAAYALDPNRQPTAEYVLFCEEAGESVRLDRGGLSRHVRIGALNKLLDDNVVWKKLPWTYKCELLPTLRLDKTGTRFEEGLQLAGQPRMTLRKLRDWRKELPENKTPKSPPLKGISLAGLERLVTQGDKLGSKRARTEALKKTARMDETERNTLIDKLEESIGHVLAFIAEARASGLVRSASEPEKAPEAKTVLSTNVQADEAHVPVPEESLITTTLSQAPQALAKIRELAALYQNG